MMVINSCREKELPAPDADKNRLIGQLLEETQYRNGYVSFAQVRKEQSAVAVKEKEALLHALTGDRRDISFVKTIVTIPSKRNENSYQEKYQLYKGDIMLRGGEYNFHFAEDTIRFIYGFFAIIAAEKFAKKYSAQRCAAAAMNYFNSSHGINDAAEATAGKAGDAVPVYYFDYALEKYRPAYEVRVTSKNWAYSENIFVSAANGAFLGAENLVPTLYF